MDRPVDQLFKLLVIGDSGVGKSCLLRRFADNEFSHNYICTIGVDFKVKTITIGNQRIKLQVWDTAGQERFRTITSTYYRGAHGVIIVYDVNDINTFLHVQQWVAEAMDYADSNIALMLVGNKNDQPDRKQVESADGLKFAADRGCLFMESSAKDNVNVEEMFYQLASKVLEVQQSRKKAAKETISLEVAPGTNKKSKSKKCC